MDVMFFFKKKNNFFFDWPPTSMTLGPFAPPLNLNQKKIFFLQNDQ